MELSSEVGDSLDGGSLPDDSPTSSFAGGSLGTSFDDDSLEDGSRKSDPLKGGSVLGSGSFQDGPVDSDSLEYSDAFDSS